MSRIYRGRPVLRLNKDTGEVLQRYNSATEAEKWLNNNGFPIAKESKIPSICRGMRSICAGFGWKYEPITDLPGEVWKQVDPKQLKYDIKIWVSTRGRVKDEYTLKNLHFRKGYTRIGIGRPSKQYDVHRLVAIAFILNPDNKPEVDHIDKNRANNCIENLRWLTHLENSKYSLAIPVNQYSLSGELIKTHESMTEAAKALRISRGSISAACHRDNNKHKEFRWEISITPMEIDA